MSASMQHDSSAEPNLTPILDMVFQLITFFMLVTSFKSAALDAQLTLPVVGSARPVDTEGQEDLLILNLDKEGKLRIFGQEKEIEPYIAGEAQASLLKLRRAKGDAKLGDELPTTVVIRADTGTKFSLLNKVIAACNRHGFRKFALKAMNKRKESE